LLGASTLQLTVPPGAVKFMNARHPHDGTSVPQLVKTSKLPPVWMPVAARTPYSARLAGEVGSSGV